MSDHEFTLRGRLALLQCWHRLTEDEVDDLIAFAGEPVGHLYTIAGVQHCTITTALDDCALYALKGPSK